MATMITLNLSNQQLTELLQQAVNNPNARNRKNSLIVSLRELGIANKQIAQLLQIDEDTVTNQVKKYANDGLENLLRDNFKKKPVS